MTALAVAKIETILFSSKNCGRVFLFLSGALYPLSFAPFNFWPVSFISIGLLLFALMKQRHLSAFKLGFYWGLGCFLVGASWVYVSIHEFGFVPWPGAVLLSLAFAAYLALFKGLFAYLLNKLQRHLNAFMLIFSAPLIWLFCELLQSVVFSGFPWLLAGYSQIDSPLSIVAPLLGVYGISWFVLAMSSGFVLCLYGQNRHVASISLGILFSLLIVFYLNQSKPDKTGSQTLDIALVQPNIAQAKKWNRRYFAEIIAVLEKETQPLWGADLVIWPEGAIPAFEHQVQQVTNEMTRLAKANNSHLIVGIPQYEVASDRSYVALKAYGENKQTYFKQVLVPFGEYVPLQHWLRGMIQFLDLPMSSFTPAENQQPMSFNSFSLIPAICYEIVYPNIIRQLSLLAGKKNKPQLIVTVSNDAWFGDSLGPYQHMQMARMRALELGLPLVRATNDGITAFVDEKGNMIKQLPRYFQGSLRDDLVLSNINTPYRRWGFTGIMSILLISGLFILIALLKERQFKQN